MAGFQHKNTPPDGIPCNHPGCLLHVSHPCEGCGRIAGLPVQKYIDRRLARKDAEISLYKTALSRIAEEDVRESQHLTHFDPAGSDYVVEEFPGPFAKIAMEALRQAEAQKIKEAPACPAS